MYLNQFYYKSTVYSNFVSGGKWLKNLTNQPMLYIKHHQSFVNTINTPSFQGIIFSLLIQMRSICLGRAKGNTLLHSCIADHFSLVVSIEALNIDLVLPFIAHGQHSLCLFGGRCFTSLVQCTNRLFKQRQFSFINPIQPPRNKGHNFIQSLASYKGEKIAAFVPRGSLRWTRAKESSLLLSC